MRFKVEVSQNMPPDIIQIVHAGGTTYWNTKTGKSVTFTHPTVMELCERVQFVPTVEEAK